jgi:hypothetical protein
MEPNTGSKVLYPSFDSPLTLPVQDPDGEPSISITVACSWLPYIRGALYQLTQQWSWPQDDQVALDLAQARALTLIAMFVECEEPIPPFSCNYDFTISDAGWTVDDPDGHGIYDAGIGFVGTSRLPGSNDFVRAVHHFDTSATLTHVKFTYTSTADGTGANQNATILGFTVSGPTVLHTESLLAGSHEVEWFGTFDDCVEITIGADSGTTTADVVIIDARTDGLSPDGCF